MKFQLIEHHKKVIESEISGVFRGFLNMEFRFLVGQVVGIEPLGEGVGLGWTRLDWV